jgi:hypothetical protein
MDIAADLKEALTIIEALGKEVAPGPTEAVDTSIRDLLRFTVMVAHPNTLAYKWATASLAALP